MNHTSSGGNHYAGRGRPPYPTCTGIPHYPGLSAADAVWLARSCERAGVPLRVEDPAAIAAAAWALRR